MDPEVRRRVHVILEAPEHRSGATIIRSSPVVEQGTKVASTTNEHSPREEGCVACFAKSDLNSLILVG